MRIVVDSGMDMPKKMIEKHNIKVVPLTLTLDGRTYVGEKEITNEQFYDALSKTESFPTTSTPSPGDFAEAYREVAKEDPDILSIHISSGLSGTYGAAINGGNLVPEANITHIDSKTLSAMIGWQVEVAAKAIERGYSVDKIIKTLKDLNEKCNVMFTLKDLRNLRNSGRVSHLKGIIAAVLHIKPVITVSKDKGIYQTITQQRTMSKAIKAVVDNLINMYGDNPVRIQLVNTGNPEDMKILETMIREKINATFSPTLAAATALGAHSGSTLIGVVSGPLDYINNIFSE